MPKILEYLGIVIRFYSDEHEPIHVHAQYGDTEMKVEFYIEDNVITDLKYLKVRGKDPLPTTQNFQTIRRINGRI